MKTITEEAIMSKHFVVLGFFCLLPIFAFAQPAGQATNGEAAVYKIDSTGAITPYDSTKAKPVANPSIELNIPPPQETIGEPNEYQAPDDGKAPPEDEQGDTVIYSDYLLWKKACNEPLDDTSTKCPPYLSFFYENNIVNGKSNSLFGLNLEIFLSEYFSFNYSVGVGQIDGITFTRATPGIEAAGWYLKNTEESSEQYLEEGDAEAQASRYLVAILLAMVPQGINVYIPVSGNTKLGFSFNPMNTYYNEGKAFWGVNCDMKLMFEFPRTKTMVAPYFGITNIPELKLTPFHFGVMLGVRF